MKYFIGIDVGSSSVRGGMFDAKGNLKVQSKCDINQWNPQPLFYEQSSDDIWMKVTSIVKKLRNGLGKNDEIGGIAFDATCSLVVLDKKTLCPKSVSLSGKENRNIIMWMDHRAGVEAEVINKTNHKLLKYVGNKISIEMEPPKLMWLKKSFGEDYLRENYFFSLADFLTYKATGNLTRSLNTLICKWMFDGENCTWDASFWHSVGLDALTENNFESIGCSFASPGSKLEPGLSTDASVAMNLQQGCPVGVSMIDAYAGALSSSFCRGCCESLNGRLAIIAGTSTCHITNTDVCLFCPGVWGPYRSATLPSVWSLEAGQSATGSLIDHIASLFSCPSSLKDIENVLENLRMELQLENIAYLTQDVHVLPDFHGNRSPLADHTLRGMISGLQLDGSEKAACVNYLATIQALAYGTRHIIESMKSSGHPDIECLIMSGGLRQNELYVQTHADVVGRPVLLPNATESMLLGSAMLARAAADGEMLSVIASDMAGGGQMYKPNENLLNYHQKKYAVYHELLKCQKTCKGLMES